MLRVSHAYSQMDLFRTFDIKLLKFKEGSGGGRELKALYKYESKSILVAKIFLALIKMIIVDMVKEGSTFHFPTKAISMFTWKKLQGPSFTKAYVSGKFTNLDFLQANFTIFTPIMKFHYRGSFTELDMGLSKELKEEIIENTNNGFKYC